MNFTKNLPNLLWQNQTIRQTVFKNTFWLSFGQIISRLIKFMLIIYAARLLGSSGYGSFAYILSFTSLAFMFSDLGLSSLMLREYNKPETDKNKLVANTLYVKIFLGVTSTLLTFLLSYFIQDPIAKSALIFIVAMYFLDGIKDVFIGVARAKEKMEIESVIVIASAFITSFVGIWFLIAFTTIQTLGLAYLMGSISSFGLTILLIIKLFPREFQKPDINYIKKILTTAWPFAFGFMVATILISTDTVMLGFLKDSKAVGQYSVGVRIVQVLLTIPAFLSVALMPSLSRFIEEKERIINFTKKAISYVAMLGIPLFFGGLIIAPVLIPKLFGNEYILGIPSFQILMFLTIIVFPIIILDYTLLALNLQIKNFQYTAIAAIVNIVLNLWLIPKYSLYGAAIATVASQTINLILTANLIKTVLHQSIWAIKPLINFFGASLVIGGLILGLIQIHLSLWLIIILAILAYFTLLYLIKEKNVLEIAELFKINN